MSHTKVQKYSIRIAGHMTSVSLEPPFWEALQHIAAREKRSMADIITSIDEGRQTNLSSALRLYVLNSFQATDRPNLE